ncbi:germ cell nuclear acidic protein-like [Schistocerca nitens]|uniref:germ cell nuclear acidic protein-like n=1 Tax=Schistocerca nitens TaxID=7011 RepID=UPI00211950E0|nr:germ cell nuclear acidic protein-like [Schistocerca nitens]
MKGGVVRSQTHGAIDDEPATLHRLHRERERAQTRAIRELSDATGRKITTKWDMMRHLEEHFSDLFKGDVPDDAETAKILEETRRQLNSTDRALLTEAVTGRSQRCPQNLRQRNTTPVPGRDPDAEDSSAEDSSAEDSSAEDSSAEDSSAEDSSAEDSSAEDSSAEDSSAEDSSAEDSSAEDSSAEDSSAEDSSDEDSSDEDSSDEDSSDEDSSDEDSSDEDSSDENSSRLPPDHSFKHGLQANSKTRR